LLSREWTIGGFEIQLEPDDSGPRFAASSTPAGDERSLSALPRRRNFGASFLPDRAPKNSHAK
jgi:hypothetical protein